MKTSREFLLKRHLIPYKKFRVPSKSKPGKFHIVEVFGDGHYECDCIAGLYKRACNHKQKVAEHLGIL